jgi:hypothetical protein
MDERDSANKEETMIDIPRDLLIECCKMLNARYERGGDWPPGNERPPACFRHVHALVYAKAVESDHIHWYSAIENLVCTQAVRLVAKEL